MAQHIGAEISSEIASHLNIYHCAIEWCFQKYLWNHIFHRITSWKYQVVAYFEHYHLILRLWVVFHKQIISISKSFYQCNSWKESTSMCSNSWSGVGKFVVIIGRRWQFLLQSSGTIQWKLPRFKTTLLAPTHWDGSDTKDWFTFYFSWSLFTI